MVNNPFDNLNDASGTLKGKQVPALAPDPITEDASKFVSPAQVPYGDDSHYR